MPATLYSLAISHPGNAARLMLEHKGIEHRVVNVPPGTHSVVVRARGFKENTVPALQLEDGRRIQGSREIARELELLAPEPPLYPSDPDLRKAVEDAEAWGESELQSMPRKCIRWGASSSRKLRRALADSQGFPLPVVSSELMWPVASLYARAEGANDEAVCSVLNELPAALDRVDGLIADGVIAGESPNVADFQILTTICSILAFDDLSPFAAGRLCEAPARALWRVPSRTIPPFLPPEWLPEPYVASSAATA